MKSFGLPDDFIKRDFVAGLAAGLWDQSSMRAEKRKSSAWILEERRRVWESKEILRRLYAKWYGLIQEALKPGRTLELGGGSGNLKEFLPEAITTDLVYEPWLDAVIDAHALPFRNESLDNLVLFDVLHHLTAPGTFFHEVERVLNRGGRAVMMEPYISLASLPVYRFMHQEGMRWVANPFWDQWPQRKESFEGNQAIPTLVFKKYRAEFLRKFPRLHILKAERMDCILYPLSGGFHHRSLCPEPLRKFLEKVEERMHCLRPLMAFRIFVVVEKSA